MAKPANSKTARAEAAIAVGGSMAPAPDGSASVSVADVAQRAYDLLARGCEPGHDVEDWLEVERDLRGAVTILTQDVRGAS